MFPSRLFPPRLFPPRLFPRREILPYRLNGVEVLVRRGPYQVVILSEIRRTEVPNDTEPIIVKNPVSGIIVNNPTEPIEVQLP